MSLPSERKQEDLPERERSWKDAPSRAVRISPKERQVIALLLEAYDNQEIADKLGMKLRTVKAYFHRLFVKFQITDGVKRIKLAVLLYRAQLDGKSY